MAAPAHTGTAALTPFLHFLVSPPLPGPAQLFALGPDQLGKRLAFVVGFQHPLRGREPLGELASNSSLVTIFLSPTTSPNGAAYELGRGRPLLSLLSTNLALALRGPLPRQGLPPSTRAPALAPSLHCSWHPLPCSSFQGRRAVHTGNIYSPDWPW